MEIMDRISLKEQRFLVIGLGISGRAAAEWLLAHGAAVAGVDDNIDIFQSAQIVNLQQQGLELLIQQPVTISSFDCVVVSPGVARNNCHYTAAREAGVEIIGDIELAARYLDKRCVGITGTNGKTTATLLAAHMLQQCGRQARAVGNCGVPPLAIQGPHSSPETIGIVELSSFQLETLHTPFLEAAAVLNITPDHIDRYGSMEEYANVKLSIFERIKGGGPGYIHRQCAEEFQPKLPSSCFVQSYSQPGGPALHVHQSSVIFNGIVEGLLPSSLAEAPTHDVENFLVAYALCRHFEPSAERLIAAAATFAKPAHRLQHVRSHRGIDYIDDSKGTNVDAVIKAVTAIKGPIILIAGGVDKGGSYAPWLQPFANKVKAIFVIGEAAEKIYKELAPHFHIERCASLQAAVQRAAAYGCEGDTVLLSPGCSSYDMFANYAERGKRFQAFVKAL
jgi:UDP-N-acetylmuramoylalanine--D-glutamate ligase